MYTEFVRKGPKLHLIIVILKYWYIVVFFLAIVHLFEPSRANKLQLTISCKIYRTVIGCKCHVYNKKKSSVILFQWRQRNIKLVASGMYRTRTTSSLWQIFIRYKSNICFTSERSFFSLIYNTTMMSKPVVAVVDF